MSFILDALRKSETERQKAQVPGIGDSPLVVHRNHVPKWMVGVIAGLSACLVALVWIWLRDTGNDVEQNVAGVTDPTTQTTTGAATASAPPASPASTTAPAARQSGEVRDLSVEARQATVSPDATGDGRSPATTAAPPPVMPEFAALPMVTLAQYRASGGALPELNLELHVYSPTAAERFVFINSTKYVEGQTLAEGPRLGAITEAGAVLLHQGRSLLLPRE